MKLFKEGEESGYKVSIEDITRESNVLVHMNKSVLLLEKLETTKVFDRNLYDTTLSYIYEDLGYNGDVVLTSESLMEKAKSVAKRVWRKIKDYIERFVMMWTSLDYKLTRLLRSGMIRTKLVPTYLGLEKSIINSQLSQEEKKVLLRFKTAQLDEPAQLTLNFNFEHLLNMRSTHDLFSYVTDEGNDTFTLNMNNGSAIFSYHRINMQVIQGSPLVIWNTVTALDNVGKLSTLAERQHRLARKMHKVAQGCGAPEAAAYMSEFLKDGDSILKAAIDAGKRTHFINQIAASVVANKVVPGLLEISSDDIGHY